jgi:cysteine sulfinate desulfinase/cysteine desulfurase-like protein/glyoxylase-like metal-dependent hydrolase (beta-lactamase superfamily II)/rhodanese-related sulfurtransferase
MLTLTEIQPQRDEIYLDNNATTAVLPQAVQAANHAMQLCYGNPSSSHMTGIKAKYILESTRKLVAQVIGSGKGQVIFTSGATEGIQTAIISGLNAVKKRGISSKNPVLLYGATEHKAVPETLKHWNEMLDIGARVVAIPVDENGLLDFNFITEHGADALMICTMAVNNETGVYQDLEALEQVIRAANPQVLWMVDCVQALGKRPLALENATIDYAPFSGHKLFALKGIGVLYIRENAPYTAFIAGGGQENGLRSGTENLPGIASLHAIFSLLADPEDNTFKSHEQLLGYRQLLADTLSEVFPSIIFNHDFQYSVPTTLNFSVKGLADKDVMDLFDAARIRVSSGSACSSKVAGSFVLDAMGKDKWQSEAAIRLSFGPASSLQEIEQACEAIRKAGAALQHNCLLLSDVDDLSSFGVEGLQQWIYDNHCTWLYVDQQAKACLLIDPVAEISNKFDTLVKCQGYKVKAVLDSHRHPQQPSCSPIIREIIDAQMFGQQMDSLGWPAQCQQLTLDNGMTVDAIHIGNKVLARLELPGHTQDSTAFLLGDAKAGQLPAAAIDFAFVGDTVQSGGLGRSEFSDSNNDQLYASLQLLAQVITPETLLCPAHDYQQMFTTTLAKEMADNELLAGVLAGKLTREEFVTVKSQLDSDRQASEQALYCGKITVSKASGFDIEPENFAGFLQQHPEAVVLDVREPHEFEAHRDEYIQEQKLVNLPLTQLTNFIADATNDKRQQIYICICRSGNRSGAAAKTLTRMGFNQVYHVPGGFALLN